MLPLLLASRLAQRDVWLAVGGASNTAHSVPTIQFCAESLIQFGRILFNPHFYSNEGNPSFDNRAQCLFITLPHGFDLNLIQQP